MANLQQTQIVEQMLRTNTPSVTYTQPSNAAPTGGPMGVELRTFPYSIYSARMITGPTGIHRFRISYSTTMNEMLEVWISKRRDSRTANFSGFYHFGNKQPGDNDFRVITQTTIGQSGFDNGRLTYAGYSTSIDLDGVAVVQSQRRWAHFNWDYNVGAANENLYVLVMQYHSNTNREPRIFWIS